MQEEIFIHSSNIDEVAFLVVRKSKEDFLSLEKKWLQRTVSHRVKNPSFFQSLLDVCTGNEYFILVMILKS